MLEVTTLDHMKLKLKIRALSLNTSGDVFKERALIFNFNVLEVTTLDHKPCEAGAIKIKINK